jgi:acyl-CoA synthetase (AMP-forming)/AMP-acid ligase II
MKVYPADIDSVVDRFEGATDVCAFAVPDPLLGEEVAVAVVLSHSDPATLGRLYDWTAAHLARHQMPSRWYLLTEIPRTSRGKVNRAAIAEYCRALAPAPMPRSRSA